MTASRCLHEAQRIAARPSGEWASEVMKLPTACGNADCTHGNCQTVCQGWLLMQFQINRGKSHAKAIDMADKRKGAK